jgi:hypothetical protein
MDFDSAFLHFNKSNFHLFNGYILPFFNVFYQSRIAALRRGKAAQPGMAARSRVHEARLLVYRYSSRQQTHSWYYEAKIAISGENGCKSFIYRRTNYGTCIHAGGSLTVT